MAENIGRRTILSSAAAAMAASYLDVGTAGAASRRPRPLAAQGPALDTLVFGDDASETAHDLAATNSESLAGGLGQSARRFLPTEPAGTWGGNASFAMNVDPALTNYVTLKLWGEEAGSALGRLQLFCDGKQVGHHHLGAVDPLDVAWQEKRLPGRFFFHTLPLPPWSTQGRTTVRLEIRAMGQVNPYGATATDFYKNLTGPSRGVYQIYTHTEPALTLASGDVTGSAPADRVRPENASAILDEIDRAVATEHTDWLDNTSLNLWGVLSLAAGYDLPFSPCYRSEAALERICFFIDVLYNKWLTDPAQMTGSDQQWEGFGRIGLVMTALDGHLDGALAKNVTGATTPITRRAAYANMLVASRDYWRQHLPTYTNQYIGAAIGIYSCNRGLTVIAPDRALSESKARHYVHQAVGLIPFEGSENASGTPSWPLGKSYYLVTAKGLTRELGYVGLYGEVIDGLIRLYDAVHGWNGVTDEALRARVITIVKARSVFRYQAVDTDGYRAMRMETVVGWRDSTYPGEVVYAQRNAADGHALQAAAVLQDEALTGYAQQMMRDNQLFPNLDMFATQRAPRYGLTAARVRRDYDTFRSLPASPTVLPGSWSAPDFLWADEDDGVLALKNGEEFLYASLYWRARYGVNNLARVHRVTRTTEHSATVAMQPQYEGTGEVYIEPDLIAQPHWAGAPVPAGPTLHQAWAGHRQPLARPPAGIAGGAVGKETPWAGRASFYRCAYGRYLIGMNAFADTAYTLDTRRWGRSRNLATGQVVTPGDGLRVAPLTTVVLYLV
ncbi:Tat pathway signal protein [Streptomyces thinghirensis]|uniref:Tat pathway signal sequence domain protein n=1 Tax=Streptomyces thinghirensis TaxID=551547 RepID=A0ABP9T8U9_9ACTN